MEETRGVHEFFELSYAQYLTVPRSVLQSMPPEWQAKLVALLDEMDDAIEWRPKSGCYWVTLKDSKGRFVSDPFQNYDRGRRKLALKITPIVTSCPAGHPHVDEGEWATRPHRTHRCQFVTDPPCEEHGGHALICGLEWRPRDCPTVGVAKL